LKRVEETGDSKKLAHGRLPLYIWFLGKTVSGLVC
jgi:hypothetical protein